jgi:3-deoxy-7-phosphoheptulonate synthase
MSITDACIGWEESVKILDILAEAAKQRRIKLAAEEESA